MSNAQIVDLTVVSRSFPGTPDRLIERSNILRAIDKLLAAQHAVCVEGEEGIGKTVLLTLFCRRNSQRAINIFVNPLGDFAHDPELIALDLMTQIDWLLHPKQPPQSNHEFSKSAYAALLRRLIRKVDRGEPVFFVIDGLLDLFGRERTVVESTLELLPKGVQGFKYLFSGDGRVITESGILAKSYPLAPFSQEESLHYFGDIIEDHSAINEVHEALDGVPADLASFRRLLLQGHADAKTLIESNAALQTLRDLEWRRVSTLSSDELTILSLLAHDPRSRSRTDLARIAHVDSRAVDKLFNNVSFLVTSESGAITFVNESRRIAASERLADRRREVLSLVIADLVGRSDENALVNLPEYFREADRFDELIQYLSPQYFGELLKQTQSLFLAKQRAELGFNVAERVGHHAALLRFAVHRSVIAELQESSIRESEVKATLAVGNVEEALALAQSAPLKEQRLKLLAQVIGKRTTEGEQVDSALVAQVRQLLDEIAPAALKEEAFEIASALLFVLPEKSIALVEAVSPREAEREGTDWALANLSLASLRVKPSQAVTDTITTVHRKIRNPRARAISSAVVGMFRDHSAKQMLDYVAELEQVSDRLDLLRFWLSDNRERDDALDAIEYALNLAIKTTEYSIGATVLRQIATPLPFQRNTTRLSSVLSLFDLLLVAVEQVGPSEEYVRLETILAGAELICDPPAASVRLTALHTYIHRLSDIEVKGACLARLLAALQGPLGATGWESQRNLNIEHEFDSNYDELLRQSADQRPTVKAVLSALARRMPAKALELALKLNTEPRRDGALMDLWRQIFSVPADSIQIDTVSAILESFQDVRARDEAIELAADLLSRNRQNRTGVSALVRRLFEPTRKVRGAMRRARVAARLAATSSRVEPDAQERTQSLLAVARSAFDDVADGWQKVDLAFSLATTLAKTDSANASYVELGNHLRDQLSIESAPEAAAYWCCVDLAIKAYVGLIHNDNATQAQYEELVKRIQFTPASRDRISLFTELAVGLFLADRRVEAQRVTGQHIRPHLTADAVADPEYRDELIQAAICALYHDHRSTAIEAIRALPPHMKDKAILDCMVMIAARKPPRQPISWSATRGFTELEHQGCIDICELAAYLDSDVYVYSAVVMVAATASSRLSRDRFTEQQRNDLAARLGALVAGKLPNQRFIRHEGFAIAAKAQIYRLGQRRRIHWDELSEAALALPNIPDRAYVLAIIASCLPPKFGDLRRPMLDKAVDILNGISIVSERVTGIAHLADEAKEYDAPLTKDLLKRCLPLAFQLPRDDASEVQRRLVDLAYRVDPEMARSLTSIADQDPARKRSRERTQQRILINEIKKELLEDPRMEVRRYLNEPVDVIVDLSNEMVIGLNVGSIAPFKPEVILPFAGVAAKGPISETYPIIAWIIANSVARVAATPQAKTLVTPLFESLLSSAQLSLTAGDKAAMLVRRDAQNEIDRGNVNVYPIRAGERKKALERIRQWLVENVTSELIVCDEYFGPEEMWLLQMLAANGLSDVKVQILTSRKRHDQESSTAQWDKSYRLLWSSQFCEQPPPNTYIVIAGVVPTQKSPIHERWLLTKTSGLELGTSLNAIGVSQNSRLRPMQLDEAESSYLEVTEFVNDKRRDVGGNRLEYFSFTL